MSETSLVPLLPLRDIIVFPHQVVPLFVGRERSIAALEAAMASTKEILLAAQRKAKTNEPTPDEIFEVGTMAAIIQLLRLPDGTVKVLVEGKRRARIAEYESSDAFFMVRFEEIEQPTEPGIEIEALIRSIQATFEAYQKLNKRIPPETLNVVSSIEEASKLADTIVCYLTLKLPDKQALLETGSPKRRLERLHELMQSEIEILQVEKKIRTRVKKQMEKTQKEYYLNEQMQAIQKELGERDEFKNEIQEIEDRIASKKLDQDAEQRVRTEVRKLKMMSPMSAEATVVRNYIDWVLALPWMEYTDDNLDIERAEIVLDEDHYGLKKVKDRILEHLAVQALVEKPKGPILCLVGPPGVGKTSLAKSIARSMNKKFVRMSLGGVRDEAEIRGHRRTYIGALPGKIIQSLKRAGSSNPVFLLDEVDKMSTDFRGDPSSALLEVLDPEQNGSFNDHYLDLDYDLSRVLFIATANLTTGIPAPLQDRMEIIRLEGYTEIEKLAIARRYLVAKQLESNGLGAIPVEFRDSALKLIIRRYTREAGVRNLEREIASVCRKMARETLKARNKTPRKESRFTVTEKRIPHYLGVWKYRYGQTETTDEVGLTNGLAWTSVGGDILMTEVTVMPGKGKLIITGKLGDVMQESAQAAMSYVRSRADFLGLDRNFYQKIDIHIHVPEGAMPKDGPSAGITMATSLVSALTRIPVRRNLAMTGEITLRGRVLPIGGLKEKALAAHRAKLSRVLIPKENEKDISEIPTSVRQDMEIVCVDHMDEVLKHALVHEDPESFYLKLRGPAASVLTDGLPSAGASATTPTTTAH
ncbi:MAG: endopeptidase La [Deltaproteobacteria bacterium]|nr:endopeptidase La [Deltaproteobacteria bacterium]